MKMSDVFELPVRNETGVYVESDNFRYLEAVDDAEIASKILVLDYSAHAINNHDRLTSENARLLDMLKRLTSHDNCRKDVIHLMSEADSLIQELEKGDE